MITYNVILQDADGGDHYIEGVCLAADTKPTNVANGSKLIEMDSQKLYIFDEANSTWREF